MCHPPKVNMGTTITIVKYLIVKKITTEIHNICNVIIPIMLYITINISMNFNATFNVTNNKQVKSTIMVKQKSDLIAIHSCCGDSGIL